MGAAARVRTLRAGCNMSGRILALLGDSFHASGGIAQFNRDLIVAWAELDAVTEIVLLPRFASEFGSEFKSDLPDKVVEKSPTSSLPLYVLKATLESIFRPPWLRHARCVTHFP